MLFLPQARKDQSNQYGCLAIDDHNLVQHYAEKVFLCEIPIYASTDFMLQPVSFISNNINCGIYLLSASVFAVIKEVCWLFSLDVMDQLAPQVFLRNHDDETSPVEEIYFETDILPKLVGKKVPIYFS